MRRRLRLMTILAVVVRIATRSARTQPRLPLGRIGSQTPYQVVPPTLRTERTRNTVRRPLTLSLPKRALMRADLEGAAKATTGPSAVATRQCGAGAGVGRDLKTAVARGEGLTAGSAVAPPPERESQAPRPISTTPTPTRHDEREDDRGGFGQRSPQQSTFRSG